MPAKRPAHKKSVSFSDSHSSGSTAEDGTYRILFSVKLIPVHIVALVYSLFQQDLSPDNVTSLLSFYLNLLISAQALYAVVFNSTIIETRKSKERTLKFNIASDFSLLFIGALICALSVPVLYAVLVVFGAPFTTYVWENVLLAGHLSVLCFPVVVSNLKVGQLTPGFYKYFAGVFIGAWFGAMAIPLDWDRPWQNWPLPIVGGGYVGAAVAYIVGAFV